MLAPGVRLGVVSRSSAPRGADTRRHLPTRLADDRGDFVITGPTLATSRRANLRRAVAHVRRAVLAGRLS